MTSKEYQELLQIEHNNFLARKNLLAKKYALSNNPFQIGNIITDHMGSILIRSIKISFAFNNTTPECVYYGIELKKDGKPCKKQTNRGAWQSNLIIKGD